jgi:hypothetical protein
MLFPAEPPQYRTYAQRNMKVTFNCRIKKFFQRFGWGEGGVITTTDIYSEGMKNGIV